MITNRCIVILYSPTWDAPAQLSKHHLARYWAKRNRVLYVEAPPNPLSFLTRRDEARRLLQRSLWGPTQAAPQLWVKSYLYALPYRRRPSFLGVRWVNDLNQWLILPRLRHLLHELDFQEPIFVVGGAHALPLIERLPGKLTVYHCSDDYTQVPSFPASFTNLERELMGHCDLVIVTAEELRRAKAHLHSDVYTVTNGAEVGHFARTQEQQTEVAEELVRLPRPIVGYIGSIFEWIDQEMIAYAAQARPDWSFVFIGPPGTDVGLLRPLRNVHFLGPRPYAELPRYLKGFDVATVPFVIEHVTLRASPIKFYEYLASGVPVVATRLPDFEPFAHLGRLVTTPEEFVTALEDAIAHDTPQKRRARMTEARNHSWEARFAQIDRLIEDALERKRASTSNVQRSNV